MVAYCGQQFEGSAKILDYCQVASWTRLVAFALTTGNDFRTVTHVPTLEGRMDGDFGLYTSGIAEATAPLQTFEHSRRPVGFADQRDHGPALPVGSSVLPLQPRDPASRAGVHAPQVLVCHDARRLH